MNRSTTTTTTCWYEILGLPQLSDTDAVKKAFRQMSLKHHPDKGGDVDKFHELQQASQYLLDPAQKKEYDAKISQVTMADLQRKQREEKMGAERKRMADDLLRRETQELKRPKHVINDLKAKARKHVEDMQVKRAQQAQERAHLLGKDVKRGDIKQRTIRVSWSNSKGSHSDETLVAAFREYGEIELVKMKGPDSARIIFVNALSATQAARIEGHNDITWRKVTLVGHAVHEQASAKHHHHHSHHHDQHSHHHETDAAKVQLELHPISPAELAQFEAVVFAHLNALSQRGVPTS
ncbi:hypothetical protein B5M09_009057 [Aphanomyces astaci]|uniref:J domain-containing protein n=2 Tax=Aphanomyces astaci TaxID=112090 RepID=A0A425C551_APHAT|nr:hypothetical protein B5M09_009057 [Aphanomyces astaci]